MELSTLNHLFILEASLRSNEGSQTLEETKNLPPTKQETVVRALIRDVLNDKLTAKLQLASGQTFEAKLPRELPPGTKLLLQLRPDLAPTILRAILPNGSSALPPAQGPSPLAQILVHNLARAGDEIKLQPQGASPLPSAGAKVLGRIQGIPSGGVQTLILASGKALEVAVPPVFPPGSEVILKISKDQVAKLLEVRPPEPEIRSASTQSAQQPTQQGAQISASAQGIGRTSPLNPQQAIVRLLTPLPTSIATDQVLQGKLIPNASPSNNTPGGIQNATLVLENGVSLRIETNIPVQTEQNMAIRFTPDGVAEVVRLAGAKPLKAHPQPNEQQTGQQTGSRAQGDGQPPPQTQTKAESQLPLQGQLAVGKVVEQRPGGQLIVAFGDKLKVPVQAQRLIPVGTQLSVQIMPDGHAKILDMHMPSGTERANALMKFSIGWETLRHTYQTLKKDQPEAAQQLKNMLPQGDETLLPKLLQFSQAVASKNLETFFGREFLNVLRALGLDTMFSADITQMHTLQQKTDAPDHWRSIFFPYWDNAEDEPRQGSFYWRHQKDKDENNQEQDYVRFVLNVDMTRLGSIQLDGLMHEKQINLHIKSQEVMTDTFKNGLKTIFDETITGLALEGSVSFDTVSFFNVDPLHELIRPDNGASQVNVEV